MPRLPRESLCAAVTLLAASCGGGSPTQPTPGSPPPTAFTVFIIVPEEIVFGPGDTAAVVGLAGATINSTAVDVTDRMTLESSNPAVVRIDGTRAIGVSAGQADIRATFQGLQATVPARVFPPSAVSRLVLFGTGGSNPCWPNDQLGLGVDVVLDDGMRVSARGVNWRSSAPGVASVDSSGNVTCINPGQAVVEASYQGRTVSTTVSVRVPEDSLELRGFSTTGRPQPGNTVRVGRDGFYVLVSAMSGEIVQSVATPEGAAVAPDVTFPIQRGSGPWHLTTTFTVPSGVSAFCTRVVMRIHGSSREIEPRPRDCESVR